MRLPRHKKLTATLNANNSRNTFRRMLILAQLASECVSSRENRSYLAEMHLKTFPLFFPLAIWSSPRCYTNVPQLWRFEARDSVTVWSLARPITSQQSPDCWSFSDGRAFYSSAVPFTKYVFQHSESCPVGKSVEAKDFALHSG